MIARVLVIAGSDSGGGAGIQADIKTVTVLGGHAMTAITAVTAQNTLGVQAVHAVPTDMVLAQIESVVSDIGVDAVKIGMIGSAATACAVAEVLQTIGGVSPGAAPLPTLSPQGRELSVGGAVVFDPVMVATSGSVLADAATVEAFGRLMRIATLVTPNLPELTALGGEAAVRAFGPALLVKGGHGEGDTVVDRLIATDGSERLFANARIDTRHTHGTGCTLASAIAVGLAQGLALDAAVERGIAFVRSALAHAPGIGKGHGPMGHALATIPYDRCRD